jgi:transcriptional regulator NrdR family protein
MVCILCDSKTKTTNSRYMRSFRHTWRRHTCTRCFAVFTTRETVDMAHSYRIEQHDGSLVVFSRDKLLMSVYEALAHRKDAGTSSSIITESILAVIQKHHRLLIPRNELVDTAKVVIKRFDRTAYVRYVSMHI